MEEVPKNVDGPRRTRVDLLPATGKDIALIVAGQADPASLERKMAALRRGSQGPAVKRLQEKIGLTAAPSTGISASARWTGS